MRRRLLFLLAMLLLLTTVSPSAGQKPLSQPQMAAFYDKACQYWALKLRGAPADRLEAVLAEVKAYDAFSWKDLRSEFLKPFRGPRLKDRKGQQKLTRPPAGLEDCYYIVQGDRGRSRTRPLVVCLHGGSRGIGDPGQIMGLLGNTYLGKKCIVAAPKVPAEAVFAEPISARLVREMIWEIGMEYAVDFDRIYCTGHSLGGVGAWYMAGVMPDLFAAAAPAAGNPPAIVDYEYLYNTPLYVVHGATDIQVTPDADRQAAEIIKNLPKENKREGWFVYREILTKDGRGHALPNDVVRDMAEFMLRFRRSYAPDRVICACPLTRGRDLEIEPNARCFWLVIEGSPWGSKADGRIEKDNTLRITFTGAGRLIVYLSDDMVDLDRPVKIWVNGQLKVDRVVPRSAQFLLEHIDQTRDRGRTFANQVVVAGDM
ncbi:MAG: hypothetical protein JXQ29_02850 [Planctomycetes bacterium]|nr:hypothetical protein [Planctomycetota bacterium]